MANPETNERTQPESHADRADRLKRRCSELWDRLCLVDPEYTSNSGDGAPKVGLIAERDAAIARAEAAEAEREEALADLELLRDLVNNCVDKLEAAIK